MSERCGQDRHPKLIQSHRQMLRQTQARVCVQAHRHPIGDVPAVVSCTLAPPGVITLPKAQRGPQGTEGIPKAQRGCQAGL